MPRDVSSLTDPTVQISRSGFLKQGSLIHLQPCRILGRSNG